MLTQDKKSNILNYPKAKKLFDQTIKTLRIKFKSFNDDQLQAFGVQMYNFFKGYE